MRRLKRVPLIALATVTVAAATLAVETGAVARESGAAPVAVRPDVPQLRREGRWLVDPQGRVVIVHGLNLVHKLDPYAPLETADGFTAVDADWLAEHGFNAARIGTLWAGLTPEQPGIVDPSYVTRWQRVMDLLADRGIWMQLDFHQDQWHETYGGEGVPDWAVRRPAPYHLLPPVVAPFPTGYWTPEVSTVFDRFWANRDGLLDGWVAAWEVAARTWRDQPYSMGYDLLNEPWAGMEWELCLATGCPDTYRDELQPAFTRALEAIRAIDPAGIVWWEPQQFAGGQELDTFFEEVPGEQNLGFSWHNYCPDVFFESQGVPGGDVENCRDFSRDRNQHALRQADDMDAVPMMSEWGATDNLRAIEIDAAVADEHLMGWTHWAYKHWNDPTTADADQGLFTDDADLSSVKREKVRRLVRTYPQATAGTPLTMSFDVHSGAFDYAYLPDRAVTAPTEIFVSPLHYPDGYDVMVTGARVVGRTGTRLLVRATGSGEVNVAVRRS